MSPQVHDGSLTILGITRDDRGAYTCRAYSDQGEVLHTTRLLVQGTASIRVVGFHYLYWKALTVVAFRSMQLSGVLMYVTQLLSLCQSVNSSVWGLHVCMCACSFCTAMCVQQDLSV